MPHENAINRAELQRRKVAPTLPRDCPVCYRTLERQEVIGRYRTTYRLTCGNCGLGLETRILHRRLAPLLPPPSQEKADTVSPENPERGVY
jgi:hypothetical protein